MSECLEMRKEIVERENRCESGIERLKILYKQLEQTACQQISVSQLDGLLKQLTIL